MATSQEAAHAALAELLANAQRDAELVGALAAAVRDIPLDPIDTTDKATVVLTVQLPVAAVVGLLSWPHRLTT